MTKSFLPKSLSMDRGGITLPSLEKLMLTLSAIICLLSSIVAQNRTITGTVSDANGTPIEGETIRVKGNNRIGTAADMNGNFNLSVPPGAV